MLSTSSGGLPKRTFGYMAPVGDWIFLAASVAAGAPRMDGGGAAQVGGSGSMVPDDCSFR